MLAEYLRLFAVLFEPFLSSFCWAHWCRGILMLYGMVVKRECVCFGDWGRGVDG